MAPDLPFRRSLLLAFAATAAGCAASPVRLDISADRRWTLTDAPADAALARIADDRPDEARRHVVNETWIRVGDDHLDPSPGEAFARELAHRLRSDRNLSHLPGAIADQGLALKNFELTIVARDAVAEARTPAEQLVHGIAQSLAGAATVSLRIDASVGRHDVTGFASARTTGSPDSFSVSRLFDKAMDAIVKQLAAIP